MRVILLGTGGSPGVPLIGGPDGRGDWGACDPAEPRNRRTRTSIVVEADDGARLLVDTGPDMRAQLLANAIGRVDAILYTHAHADHIAGIDDVRILNRNLGRPIEAFGLQATLDEIAARFAYAFRPVTKPGFFRPALVARAVAPGEVVTHRRHGGPGLRAGPRLGHARSASAPAGSPIRPMSCAWTSRRCEILEGVDTWVVGCVLRDGPHPTHAHLDLVYEWVAPHPPAADGADAHGHRHGLGLADGQPAAGDRAGFDGMVLHL